MEIIKKFISKNPALLSREEEKELTLKYFETKDPAAKDKLVLSNLRLVFKMANQYDQRGFFPELVSEGVLGLMKGIEKFDPHKETRLSTYAGWWIRAYIIDYIFKNLNMIRIPRNDKTSKLFLEMKKAEERLRLNGIEVTRTNLAKHLSVSEDDIIDMNNHIAGNVFLEKENFNKEVPSEGLISWQGINPEAALATMEEKFATDNCFKEFLANLQPMEKIVFEKRMIEEESLSEVGSKIERTGERARQIELSLKKRLKKLCEVNLSDFH